MNHFVTIVVVTVPTTELLFVWNHLASIHPLLFRWFFSPLNSRSISDKSSLIKNFIANHDIDLCALTKTWLRGNDSDLYNIRDICPDGYVFYHASRLHSSGEELVLS